MITTLIIIIYLWIGIVIVSVLAENMPVDDGGGAAAILFWPFVIVISILGCFVYLAILLGKKIGEILENLLNKLP